MLNSAPVPRFCASIAGMRKMVSPTLRKAEADVSANAAVDRQHCTGCDQREITLALTDLLERPAVPLGPESARADFHQTARSRPARSRTPVKNFVRSNGPFAGGTASDQGRTKQIDHRGISDAGSLWHRLPPMCRDCDRMMRDETIGLDHDGRCRRMTSRWMAIKSPREFREVAAMKPGTSNTSVRPMWLRHSRRSPSSGNRRSSSAAGSVLMPASCDEKLSGLLPTGERRYESAGRRASCMRSADTWRLIDP